MRSLLPHLLAVLLFESAALSGAVFAAADRPADAMQEVARLRRIEKERDFVTARISSDSTSFHLGGSFDIVVDFSEPVTGFAPGDLQILGAEGQALRLTGEGSRYVATILPSGAGRCRWRFPRRP